MKVLQKAASGPMNGFLKTAKVDNFLLIFFITDGRGFHTPVHGAVRAFKLYSTVRVAFEIFFNQ
jgi:hypothetical protein